MNIIDTKSDLAFKKVFGEKPHLLINLLNSFLPLSFPIIEIEYLSPEILPDRKEDKNSIVDVRCKDNHGRHFLVEMQLARQKGFSKRVLMNTAKVYSRQFSKDDEYQIAKPVYSLNLLDHNIYTNSTEWYHTFVFTNRINPEEYWDDMQIIFIELPKWKKLNKFDLNNSQDRWLMYFTEPKLYDRLSKEEYARYSEIYEALESAESSNFSPEKIYGYELYIDSIRQYHTTMNTERREGREEGISLSFQILEELKKNVLSPEEIALKFDTDIDLVLKVKALL